MNPLTLGLLTFTAEHSPGDGVFVTVSDDSGKLCLTLQQWSSLCTVVEVLDLVDKRHEADRLEISRLDGALAETRQQLQYEQDHSKMLSESNSALHVEKRAIENYCAKVRGEYTKAQAEVKRLGKYIDIIERNLEEAARGHCQ